MLPQTHAIVMFASVLRARQTINGVDPKCFHRIIKNKNGKRRKRDKSYTKYACSRKVKAVIACLNRLSR